MFKAIDQLGNQVSIDQAVEGTEYFCPICKGLLFIRAKKSETVATHFAHKTLKDCDTFTHDMSDWHKVWQNRFPIKNQEVPLPFESPCHRADVLAYGYVIEFQHSHISVEEFDERNRFYTSIGKKVIWVFDVNDKYSKDRFSLVEPSYIYDGEYTDSHGKRRKKWIANEYRIGTMLGALGLPPELCYSNGIDYEYGHNEKYAKHLTHEWKWSNPLKNLIHYNPIVKRDVIVFLEFKPGLLQKIIWCEEEIDDYKAGTIAESIHGGGIEADMPSVKNYLQYRSEFVIRSDFRYFTATEYTERDFLVAIKDRQL